MTKKILWHSNAPWAPTGYGNQTALFTPRLKADYEVAVSAYYGLEGSPITWNGVPVLPGLGGEYGNTYLIDHARNYFDDDPRGGLLLTLLDVWVLAHPVIAKMNAASWVPVDHNPVAPDVAKYFRESAAIPIAMSKFGQKELEEFDPLYVPHGIDTEAFKPRDKADVRAELGIPKDAFLVGMVAANKGRPSRKGFQQAFEAFRAFREKHDDAYLYLHSTVGGEWAQGEELGQLIGSLQIPAEAVLIANQYRLQFAPPTAQMMSKLYSSFDVFLNPAMGEGFGIPIMEAQACGIPAIVTDFSAMKEVCGAGWKVACKPYWTPQRSWQAVAEVEDIVTSLEAAYGQSATERKDMAAAARRHAMFYDADRVYQDHFLPALEEINHRIGIWDTTAKAAAKVKVGK